MFFNKPKKEFYDLDDCIDTELYKVNLEDKYLILKPEFLDDDRKSRKHQLVKCVYGYGTDSITSQTPYLCVKEINEEGYVYKIRRDDRSILGLALSSVINKHIKEFGYNNNLEYDE